VIETAAPKLISLVLAQSPEVKVRVVADGSARLLAALKAEEIDLILGPVVDAVEDNEFLYEALADDELVVAARERHPLANRDATLDDLAGYRWLLPDTTKSRRWIEGVFRGSSRKPPIVQVESNAIVLLLKLVEDSDLLTVVSRRDLQHSKLVQGLHEIATSFPIMQRRLGLIIPRNVHFTPLTLRVISVLRTHSLDIFAA
jgi:DNA-binding transcriptional LysR family regulator